MSIQNKTEVWVVLQNTDLTEGRGWVYPMAVCEIETTANRLAKGRDVQGTDCRVEKDFAYQIDGNWYMPNRLQRPEYDDRAKQELLDKRRKAIEKARAAGLTEDDIKHLL